MPSHIPVYYLLSTGFMKFIADVMLGRLAKRLRLLGFDVLYDNTRDDNELLRLALTENRTILTRDTGLASRPLAKNHLLIESDHVGEQLLQVLGSLSITATPDALTRCSVCNETLRAIDKREAMDRVPSYVYDRMESFLQCGVCGRMYWSGTHVRNMEMREAKNSRSLNWTGHGNYYEIK